MQLFFFLLLSANLLLSAAILRQVSRSSPPDAFLPPPAPAESEPQPLDPVDQGFENIMRFTVATHRRGGEFP